MTPRQLAGYAFLALAWGLSFIVLLKVVKAFGWVGAVTFRCFVASATLFLVARAASMGGGPAVGWRHAGVMGATTVGAQLVGLSYATPLIGTAMAAILVATIPLFSLIIGQVWGIERISRASGFGLLLGFLGLVLLVGFPAEPVTSAFVIGCIASLLSAFAAAFGSNYASRHLGNARPIDITMAAFLWGGMMTLPLLLAVPVPMRPQVEDFVYLVIAGALMSALTYVIYFWLVAEIGATRAISVEFAVTLVAVLVGALYLNEPLGIMQMLGGMIIVAGCMLVLGMFPFAGNAKIQD